MCASSDYRLGFLIAHAPGQELPEGEGEQEEAEGCPRQGDAPAHLGGPAAAQVRVVTERVQRVALSAHVPDLGQHDDEGEAEEHACAHTHTHRGLSEQGTWVVHVLINLGMASGTPSEPPVRLGKGGGRRLLAYSPSISNVILACIIFEPPYKSIL